MKIIAARFSSSGYPTPAHHFRLDTYNLGHDAETENITVKYLLTKLPNPTLQPTYVSLARQERNYRVPGA